MTISMWSSASKYRTRWSEPKSRQLTYVSTLSVVIGNKDTPPLCARAVIMSLYFNFFVASFSTNIIE